MAEALAALGAASSVITFLEFSWKLLASSSEIYQSASGQSEDTLTLRAIAEDIKKLDATITHDKQKGAESSLNGLIKDTHTIADDLLRALNKLSTGGKSGKWGGLNVALREVWGKKKIEAFTDRLATLQRQILYHTQVDLLGKFGIASRQLNRLEDAIIELGVDVKVEFKHLRNDVKSSIEEASSNKRGSYEITQSLPESSFHPRFTGNTHDDSIQQTILDVSKVSNALSALRANGDQMASSRRLLTLLSFSSMRVRESKIPVAHAQTFEWIFQPELDGGRYHLHFTDWLTMENGIFWIQGKPGSGKSTLMKFIASHYKTRIALSTWAGDNLLLMASWSFWWAGSKLQKSETGLLRWLLYEFIRLDLSLGPEIDSLLDPGKRMHSDWIHNAHELLHILKSIIASQRSRKFCFFIDGLDEYKEEEIATSDFIAILKDIASQPNVKLCLASRPWSIFVDAFGDVPRYTARIQDLTRGDILHFTSEQLNNNLAFNRFKDQEFFSDLAHQISDRSQGVFLWVHLVVKDVIRGLTQADTVKILRERIDRIPPDLNGFYQHMLDRVEPIYRAHTAMMLDVARCLRSPATMVAYSFIDDIMQDKSMWRQVIHHPMEDPEFYLRLEQIKRQLDGRSRGLLEVGEHRLVSGWRPYFHLKVDFLHRTVHEFLTSSIQTSLIRDHIDEDETPLVICKMLLMEMKHAGPHDMSGDPGPLDKLNDILYYASLAEKTPRNRREITDLLQHGILARGTSDETTPTDESWRDINKRDFLVSACARGVFSAVDALPDLTTILERQGDFELFLRCAMNLVHYESCTIHVPVVKALVADQDIASSQNLSDGFANAWAYFLERLETKPRELDHDQAFEIAELFLRRGATITDDISLRLGYILLRSDGSARSETNMRAFKILKGYFRADEFRRLKRSLPRRYRDRIRIKWYQIKEV